MLTDYTTYADIRGALGVSEEDITDAVLALALYEDGLVQDLEDVDTTLPDTYQATAELETPTVPETRFLRACRQFATLSVAQKLTAAMPLFAAKQMTDGKAQVSRFDNPYRDVVAGIMSQYAAARTRLKETFDALGTLSATVTPKVYFSSFSPSVDAVTGT